MEAQELADLLEGRGRRAGELFRNAGVLDALSFDRMFQARIERFGGVDIDLTTTPHIYSGSATIRPSKNPRNHALIMFDGAIDIELAYDGGSCSTISMSLFIQHEL